MLAKPHRRISLTRRGSSFWRLWECCRES
jgi:hypothetical protein